MVFRNNLSVQCILQFIGIGRVDTTTEYPRQDFLFPLALPVSVPSPSSFHAEKWCVRPL